MTVSPHFLNERLLVRMRDGMPNDEQVVIACLTLPHRFNEALRRCDSVAGGLEQQQPGA